MSRQIHSLPEVRQLGFNWRPFEKAREKLDDVERRRAEVRRREAELEERIKTEQRADIKRLAANILRGDGDVPPPELEDLAREMREAHRLSQALAEAEPQAESELIRVVHENREKWIGEVDDAVMEALSAEREAFQEAMTIADAARAKRLQLEALSAWVRTTPPSFSPPADVSVRSAFDRLGAETDQAERLHEQRAANEQSQAQAQFEAESERLVAGGGSG